MCSALAISMASRCLMNRDRVSRNDGGTIYCHGHESTHCAGCKQPTYDSTSYTIYIIALEQKYKAQSKPFCTCNISTAAVGKGRVHLLRSLQENLIFEPSECFSSQINRAKANTNYS